VNQSSLVLPRINPLAVKAVMFSALLLAFFYLAPEAFSSVVVDEFSAASTKISGWVTGNIGKIAAFVALGIGSVMAAVKKDWSTFFAAIVIALGVGVVASVISSSFTATLAF
jgi:conjugal transfer pilus assembly protein TraA